METKSCNRCLKIKKLDEFFADKSHSSGKYSICKSCKKEATYKWRNENRSHYNKVARQWRKKNPLNCRGFNLKKKFGITYQEYENILKSQNNGCKICGSTHQYKKALAVDHCHKTGKIRAILCDNCNKGLGNFQDSPALLEKAIEYLKSHKSE